jgi:DNA replication protein DnaC
LQSSIEREQIDSLHTLGFLERKANVVFLGSPGVGRTHLALSLAIAAAESGRRYALSRKHGDDSDDRRRELTVLNDVNLSG